MAESRPQIFLSTKPAGRAQRRFALIMMAVLFGALLAGIPFVPLPLRRLPAFIPAYETLLAVNDLITAALLYAQFAILRRPCLSVLGATYLFTALIVIPHMLTFPGVFAPNGLLGAGLSSTPWLYLFWHGGFALGVLGYALLNHQPMDATQPARAARKSIAASAAIVLVLVVVATWAATTGSSILPALMTDATHQAPVLIYPSAAVLVVALIAIVALWRQERRSVLDLWLTIVLCALLCELLLSVILNPARFTLGFYLGRVYSAAASSMVLILLLFDTTALYAQLARAIATERRVRERRLREMEAMLSHLSRVTDLSHVVTSLIHEVNQPLAAIGNYLSALQRLAAMGEKEKVATTIEKTLGQSERAREIIRRLREFVARREIERRPEPLAPTVENAVAIAQAVTGRTGIEIATSLKPEGAMVVIDRLQIEQVLVNLIRNASEAMAGSARRHLAITSRLVAPEKLELTIADTGPGLPAKLRERLFQPFVTTKESGMGVGLSICRFIVEAHGEKLQVADNPGGGTVFSFTLPVAVEAMTAAELAG